jgi:hypothetical protein
MKAEDFTPGTRALLKYYGHTYSGPGWDDFLKRNGYDLKTFGQNDYNYETIFGAVLSKSRKFVIESNYPEVIFLGFLNEAPPGRFMLFTFTQRPELVMLVTANDVTKSHELMFADITIHVPKIEFELTL